ncbi:MAG TPA: efflux RND transporter periplasmic adaptor subunit [Cytophagaceae bacterium]|nr:efflux RND transporter periplasmic adaptor subunit [Cytophagaceae bacterium]
MSTRRNIFWIALLNLSFLWMVSCKGPADNKPMGPVPVSMQEVKQEEAVYYDQYPGNIVALNEVQLRSEVNGFITGIFFQEGQRVSKGQKLYVIEQSKFEAASAQANANLQIAKANYEKAKNDADRYNKLGEQGMATKQRVEYSATDLENAKSQVAVAEAEVLKTSTDLRHATIIAPFDGTIGISMVKLGAFVTAGQTQLNTISSDDPVAVDFVISEKEIGRFNQLKESKTAKTDSLFTIALPDKTIYPYPGTIEFFDRAVDPQTGTLKIRLRFPNAKRQIRTGMSCNVRVLNRNPEKLALIPYKAVTEQMGEFFVYVVEKDTAKQQKVTLGAPVNDRVIILNGLMPGQQIVVDGVQKVKNGSAVMTAPPPTAPGAPSEPVKK